MLDDKKNKTDLLTRYKFMPLKLSSIFVVTYGSGCNLREKLLKLKLRKYRTVTMLTYFDFQSERISTVQDSIQNN